MVKPSKFSSLVAAVALLRLGSAKTVKFEWDLRYETIAPNGVNKRMTLINGQFPGPTMRATLGDEVQVTLKNSLPDNGTTIHFHGINQLGTPWSDGVPSINQCPIPANGGTYTYTFTPDEAGTSFWHSHYGPQYPEGVVGPTIIDDPSEPYKYDGEYTVVLTDHYNISEWTLAAIDRTPGFVGNSGIPPRPPAPDSVLICAGSGGCNNASMATFNFSQGKTYRLRIINMSAFVGFHFSIDEHPLQLIASDFAALDGKTSVEQLPIWPAQRYDVLVKAKANYSENVWMRSVTQNACYPIQNPRLELLTRALINYDGVPVNATPTTQSFADPTANNCRDLDLSKLRPLVAQNAVAAPDQTIFLAVGLYDNLTAQSIQGVVNNSSYPTLNVTAPPTLFSVNDGMKVSSLPVSRNAYALHNGTVRVVLNTTLGPGAHPYHLHGHTYQVLGYVNGTYDGNNGLELVNPTRRDTMMVPVNATAVFQFETNNPGAWFFHCHMDWHLIEGLAAQFVELPDQIRALDIPKESRDLCSNDK